MADPITPPAVTPDAGNPEANKGGDNNNGETPKTFSQEEHQKELDRIAAKTRQEEKERAEKIIDERLKKEREEWERQTKLSQEEKEKEMREKQAKEIADRELQITLRENKAEALEKFAEAKLPTKLVDLVVDADKEAMATKIDSFSKSFNEAVEAAVADRLKGEAPPAPQTPNSNNGKPTEVVPKNFM